MNLLTSYGGTEGLLSKWRSGRDVCTRIPSCRPSTLAPASLSLFRPLDTGPPFESISNDLEYYGETLPPLEQFHSVSVPPHTFLLVSHAE